MNRINVARDMIESLRYVLGFEGWKIDILEEDLKDGVGAFVRWDDEYKQMLIVLSKEINDKDTLLRGVLHELLHVLVGSSREKIMWLLDNLLLLPTGEEMIVEGLAKALIDYSKMAKIEKEEKDGISNHSNTK